MLDQISVFLNLNQHSLTLKEIGGLGARLSDLELNFYKIPTVTSVAESRVNNSHVQLCCVKSCATLPGPVFVPLFLLKGFPHFASVLPGLETSILASATYIWIDL